MRREVGLRSSPASWSRRRTDAGPLVPQRYAGSLLTSGLAHSFAALQTEAYARAVLTGGGLIARADIERLLAARLVRQGILRQDDPPQFTAVVDEGVLRRPVGGPATMRDQLAALVTACAEPHVRVHVVPSTVGFYAGLNGPFVIATSADHRAAVYLDNQLQGHVVSEPGDIAAILTVWEDVRGEALSQRQSVDLVREVAETWS